jgi:hypothetical protein
MNRFAAIVIVVLIVAIPGSAINEEEFDQSVDFSLSLEEIHNQLNENAQALLGTEKAVVLDGIVASVTVLNPAQENFQALLELVNGEWKGLEEVVMYRTYVVVHGKQFFSRIPSRENRDPSGSRISANSRVLVAGRIANVVRGEEDGALIPVIEGFHVRDLP